MKTGKILHGADRKSLHSDNATEPAMRWLIAVALDNHTMTYGELKHRLENEAGFSTIFSAHIGHVAGPLMDKIQKVEPHAPLINVLVVNQNDLKPSKGIGSYLTKRFKIAKLSDENAKKKYSKLWEKYYQKAASEVYAYKIEDWAKLFKKTFGKDLDLAAIAKERDKRMKGAEQDGLDYNNRRYGKGGEGPEHAALRKWVTDNPGAIKKAFSKARTDTEVDLFSGDRVDSVYYCEDRTVVLEVKSRISNEIDMRRGVYQCIKYRAVKAAMDVRDNPVVEAYLVTEAEVSGEIKGLLKLHKIKHFIAAQDRT